MESKNGNQGPSNAPDFNAALANAQRTGDFEYVLRTAKDTSKMLRDFRDGILAASYPGVYSRPIAMGLNFLDNMVIQADGQLAALKQTAKTTKEALEATGKPKLDSGV